MIHRHRALAGGLLSLALCFAPAAQAGIQYQLTSQGSDLWTVDYTLDSTGAPAFDEFTIYFDRTQVQEITSFTAPADWDTLFEQADTQLPADGFVDALYLGGGALPAGPFGGFSVGFKAFAGMAPTGRQTFEFVVSDPFAVVQTGLTDLASLPPPPPPPPPPVPVPVPETGTLALVLAGLGLLPVAMRRGSGARHEQTRTRMGELA
jgi:hypothetical protein